MDANKGGGVATPIRLQDFVRLPQSLPWSLARSYWSLRGAQAFLQRRVPFQVTNDGTISRKAAELLFFSLAAGELVGRDPGSPIRVLELGAGSGLFARYFLDAFRDLCRNYERNYYKQLVYLATDRSTKMRRDILQLEILADHAEHFVVAPADAELDDLGLSEADGPGHLFSAIVLNYILDTLPATILHSDGDRVEELYASTCLNAPQAPQWLESGTPPDTEELMRILPALSMEYEYRAVDSGAPPFQATAEACLALEGPFVLHNYGALRCLESCATLLERGGFVFVSDYPHSPFDGAKRIFPWQQYDGSVSAGLNFSLLETHFRRRPGWTWCEPEGGAGVLSFRCLGREIHPVVADRFRSIFSKSAMDSLYVSWNEARRRRREGERRETLRAFEAAYARQRDNWALKSEFADFLLQELDEPQRALALASSGLENNPIYPPLWKTAGECLNCLNRHSEAHAAYRRARILLSPGAELC